MAKQKQPAGEAMTLGNMRALGVQRLIASCLNDACRHVALIEVWSYPAETEIPYFKSRVVCAKCGSRGNKIDVRPNWKEQPTQPSLDRQGVAMKRIRRMLRRRHSVLFDALIAIASAIIIVTVGHMIASAIGW